MDIFAFIILVLLIIVCQAAFLVIAPRTYLRLRNRILKTPNRFPVNRGYGRERMVGSFIILIACLLIYAFIEVILAGLDVETHFS